MNIEDIINIDFIRGILTAVVLGVAGFMWSKLKGYHKNRQRQFDYIWKPEKPIINDYSNIKEITEYKKTWKMIISEDGFDIDPVEMIDGFNAFEQHLIKLLNTERDKYKIYKGSNYGVSYILTDAKDNEEFNSMAFIVAKEIIKNEEEWIKEIHSIKKIKDKNLITIELGLKGIHEIVKINALVVPRNTRT